MARRNSARRVVVVGGGAAGEAFVGALRRLDDDVEIALVERRLIGGECTYWACMPTKTLLRPAEIAGAAERAPGAPPDEPLDPTSIFGWRDAVIESLDDSGHVEWLEQRRVEPVRGTATLAEPGVLDVDGRELRYDALVLATGSDPAVPPVEGLEQAGYWTNREATTASEVPRSVAILGAGAVGCELAQFYARLGARVVVVDPNDRPLVREDPDAGRLLREHLELEGIEFRFGRRAERAEPGRLHLDDGSTAEGERLLVATGRKPNTDGLGLDRLGVEVGPQGIVVDERLRAAEGVWAIGDVTGISLFTHVGKYQGRVAAANVAGLDRRADYRAIPRVLFTDPQVASAGTTEDGPGIVTSLWEVNRTARASTYERPKRKGFLKLFADERRRVLVGASAVGPEAGEWLGQLTLAIRAEVPVDVLRDVIQPFPTFSEAVHFAARDLPL